MRAVIYARYSSDNQREESFEGQLRECNGFAERKDYTIVTGKKADNRPQFMQMIADSKQKLFDTVSFGKLIDFQEINMTVFSTRTL